MASDVASSRFQNWGGVIVFITQAVGALLALGSVVYLLGATVLAGRLGMYSLPSEIVINQLPQSLLIAIGLTEVVAPFIGIAALYLMMLFLVWEVTRAFRRMQGRAIVLLEIFLWALAGLVVLLFFRRVLHSAGGWTDSQAIVAALVTVGGVAATNLVLFRFPKTATAWYEQRASPLLRACVVALALVPLIAWNAITLPMPFAEVCPTRSVEQASGWLVGQLSDRLVLGSTEEDRSQRHIFVAPSQNAPVMATYQDLKKHPLPPCPASPPSG